MLRLSQAKGNQVREIEDDFDFYENYDFGEFYLVEDDGDELTYIDMEDDDYILKCIHNGERVVSINEDDEEGE